MSSVEVRHKGGSVACGAADGGDAVGGSPVSSIRRRPRCHWPGVVRFADRRRCRCDVVGCRRRRVGGGDGGDSRLESREGMAEREGRREVVVWDRRDGGRGAGNGEGAVRRG
jgi:hypothetical protein